jgi:dTDP-3-amino-3,4,6-trideoxy-alpha-D-glucose transaminase
MVSAWRVPSKDYGRQYAELLPEVLARLEHALRHDDPVLGAEVAAFEEEFAAYVGAAHGVGIGSGTEALLHGLQALGVGPGDEVITAGNTFFATVTAIILAGAQPVLVDPDPRSLVLTAEGVRAALTPRTKAVIPVHLYGRLAPMDALAAVCRPAGIPLLEDAAQAHGARDAAGRRAGGFGGPAAYSFHPSKNLGAFGDAGFVATDDAALAERVRMYRHLGKVSKYEAAAASGNSKLDTLQAALLRVKLRHLDAWNARRRELAGRYLGALRDVPDLVLPEDPGGEEHAWHLFVVRTPRRDALRETLRERGINAGLHYPIPPHRQKLGVESRLPPGGLPLTEELARTVLTLPLSHEHTDAEIDLVCDEVRKALERAESRR